MLKKGIRMVKELAEKVTSADSLRIVQLGLAFIAVLVIPILVFLVRIDNRLVAIEANRFTAADGLTVWQEMARKANTTEVPPEWFIREFDELKARLLVLEGKH